MVVLVSGDGLLTAFVGVLLHFATITDLQSDWGGRHDSQIYKCSANSYAWRLYGQFNQAAFFNTTAGSISFL